MVVGGGRKSNLTVLSNYFSLLSFHSMPYYAAVTDQERSMAGQCSAAQVLVALQLHPFLCLLKISGGKDRVLFLLSTLCKPNWKFC